jgi:hypothetical protein
MVSCKTVHLRRLGRNRAGAMRFGRLLANPKVTVERLLDGWSTCTRSAVAGRHVLAIQDTSEFTFATSEGHRRGLGKIGKGGGHGLLLHAMLALDADTEFCLGLVGGSIWTRTEPVAIPHAQRSLDEKETRRWLDTARTAKLVLAAASQVTVIDDREADIYDKWALLPDKNFHLLTRAARDRCLAAKGSKLFDAASQWSEAGRRTIEVPARQAGLEQREAAREAGRARRPACLALYHGEITIKRPKNGLDKSLPETVTLRLVEVREIDAPDGFQPVVWRLLTTHAVDGSEMAWQIVDWYRQRWTIEQLFRTMKRQGLRVEDSQLETAEGLCKLTAFAAHAAVITMQLTQARDGSSKEPAAVCFSEPEIETLSALAGTLEGKTEKQKNPHARKTLAWAAWTIARLGGWNGYARERPPGPITFRRGLETFAAIHRGYMLRPNVCIR